MKNHLQKSESFFRQLKGMDFLAISLQFILLGIGTVFIYSAGVQHGGELAMLWHRQIVWIGLGTCAYFAAMHVNYLYLAKYSWLMYIAGILLLLAVFPFGSTINNARSWLIVPGFGLIQPSELVKPIVLLFMAQTATSHDLRHSNIPLWIPIVGVALLPLICIALQPDFGTALVFLPLTAAMVFIAGLKKIWITTIFCAVIILTPFIFIHLRPHQQERVKVFIELPSRAIVNHMTANMSETTRENLQTKLDNFLKVQPGRKRDNWNAIQALHAVGSGGREGKGFGKGTQHALGYLPKKVAPSDFIFSVIAEETGFFGSLTLLGLLIGLFLCYCRTATLSRTPLGAAIAIGAAVMVATHTLINIGMNVQAMPIIGIPLPFVSYGGSFVISMMTMAGLVQNVHIHRKQIENPK